MEQTSFIPDTFEDALGAAVQTAGGHKRVAAKIRPALDQASAAAWLRACLNTDHAQKPDPSEIVAMMRIGKEAGDHTPMEYLAGVLGYEIKVLSPIESKKRAKRVRRLALLEELKKLEDDE